MLLTVICLGVAGVNVRPLELARSEASNYIWFRLVGHWQVLETVPEEPIDEIDDKQPDDKQPDD
eukprot:979979-Alexandrium_andersonii.AAC.1